MKRVIYITKDDIKRGKVGDVSKCPVARAIKRKFPKNFLSVYGTVNFVNKTIPTPKQVLDWILSFDRGYEVKPLKFTLEIK